MHSEPELITTGQHDKEFEDKIIILGLEFRYGLDIGSVGTNDFYLVYHPKRSSG